MSRFQDGLADTARSKDAALRSRLNEGTEDQ
jgi:hypothetical protein